MRAHTFQKTSIAATVFILAGIAAALFAAPADARVGLYPGMPIRFGNGVCSLGFLATNAAGDRLAVTAGHCADAVNQHVRSNHGNPVGTVVLHAPDDLDNNKYGGTVIKLARRTYASDAYFTKFGDPQKGDVIAKYGERTQKTTGSIINTGRNGVLHSNLIALPGDSGAPWVTSHNGSIQLAGIHIGASSNRDGSQAYAIGYGINEIVWIIRSHGGRWGNGFLPIGR